MGIIKLENIIVEIKSSVDEHNSKMEVGRKKISKLENRNIEINKFKRRQKNSKKKKKETEP